MDDGLKKSSTLRALALHETDSNQFHLLVSSLHATHTSRFECQTRLNAAIYGWYNYRIFNMNWTVTILTVAALLLFSVMNPGSEFTLGDNVVLFGSVLIMRAYLDWLFGLLYEQDE